jgi:predicted RNase H-like nuclease (RuvC/YqgF family)
MKTDHELECIIDRLGQEMARLTSMARTGEKAVAELAHFRQSFGLAPELDLVVEFDRRGQASDQRIAELEQQLFKATVQIETMERSQPPYAFSA